MLRSSDINQILRKHGWETMTRDKVGNFKINVGELSKTERKFLILILQCSQREGEKWVTLPFDLMKYCRTEKEVILSCKIEKKIWNEDKDNMYPIKQLLEALLKADSHAEK